MTVPVLMTANRLADRVVVWLQADLHWSVDRAAAAGFSGAEYDAARTKAETDILANRIIAFYEIPVDGKANQSAREMIRGAGGPSIRPPADRPG